MLDRMKEERRIVMFVFSSMTRGHELLKKLKDKLDELNILEYFNLELRRFRKPDMVDKAISEMRPVLVIVELNQFKEPEGGFGLLEDSLKTVTPQYPFYSMLYGKDFDVSRKKRSKEINDIDPFHLGTCSSRTKNDNMLLDKVVGILVQDPKYVAFQHLETAAGSKAQQIVRGLIESIDPIKEGLEDFGKGNEECFYGIERVLINLDKELARLQSYYNELYTLFSSKRLQVIPPPEVMDSLKRVSQYLNDRKSPLVQLVMWLKTIDRSLSTSSDICNFLERRIGGYQIGGFCTVFMDRYKEFKDDLQAIQKFIDEPVKNS